MVKWHKFRFRTITCIVNFSFYDTMYSFVGTLIISSEFENFTCYCWYGKNKISNCLLFSLQLHYRNIGPFYPGPTVSIHHRRSPNHGVASSPSSHVSEGAIIFKSSLMRWGRMHHDDEPTNDWNWKKTRTALYFTRWWCCWLPWFNSDSRLLRPVRWIGQSIIRWWVWTYGGEAISAGKSAVFSFWSITVGRIGSVEWQVAIRKKTWWAP